jgi:hypothetical protein
LLRRFSRSNQIEVIGTVEITLQSENRYQRGGGHLLGCDVHRVSPECFMMVV